MLVQWFGGGGGEIARSNKPVCSCLDIFRPFLYVMCISFYCVYSVYNGQVSPNFATSSL